MSISFTPCRCLRAPHFCTVYPDSSYDELKKNQKPKIKTKGKDKQGPPNCQSLTMTMTITITITNSVLIIVVVSNANRAASISDKPLPHSVHPTAHAQAPQDLKQTAHVWMDGMAKPRRLSLILHTNWRDAILTPPDMPRTKPPEHAFVVACDCDFVVDDDDVVEILRR